MDESTINRSGSVSPIRTTNPIIYPSNQGNLTRVVSGNLSPAPVYPHNVNQSKIELSYRPESPDQRNLQNLIHRSHSPVLSQPMPSNPAPIISNKPTSQTYNPLPQPMERRVIFTDAQTGQQKVKITSPRGNTILRIEPLDDFNNSRHNISGQGNGHSNQFTPTRALNTIHFTPNRDQQYRDLHTTPTRLMTPNRTPTRAGYSPGGVYMNNKELSPYNFTPGGTGVQTKINEVSRETLIMINDAKNDFKDPVIEDIELEVPAFKIEVTEDGSRVYYGGEGLGEL